MEFVDEKNFKESIKNKIYFYNENYGEELDLDIYNNNKENIIDKCLICSEDLIENNSDKINSKNNILSSEEENESNLIFTNNKINVIEENEKINTQDNLAKCPHCKSQFHIICLAQSNLENKNILTFSLIPKDTNCIICGRDYNWSEYLKD